MMQQRQPDDPMEALLRRGLKQAAALGCPSADVLAAYFELSLPAGELPEWELHFSQCARCQEQLASLARIESVAGPASAARQHVPGFSFLNWKWLAPVLAGLGAVTIWVVIQGPEERRVATTATNQAAATEGLAPPAGQLEKTEEEPRAALPDDHRKDAGKTKEEFQARAREADRAASGAPSPDPFNRPTKVAASTGQADKSEVAASRPEEAVVAGADEKKKDGVMAAAAPVEAVRKADAVTSEMKLGARVAAHEAPAGQKPQAPQPEQMQAQAAAQGEQRARDLGKQRSQAQLPQAATQQAEGARFEARPLATLGRTEAPPKQDDSSLSNAVTRQTLLRPVLTAAAPQGRIEWRFYADGRIERYDQRLKSSESTTSPVEAELLAASAPSEKICWAAGRRGAMIRTTQGLQWKAVGSPSDENLVFIDAQDELRATVRTVSGKSYVTTDGGKTWRSQTAR
jgi:hypothetical protein